MSGKVLRWRNISQAIEDGRPAFATVEVQSVILKYVVAEGPAESACELIEWYILEHGGDREHVVRSFVDLVVRGVLCIHEGKGSPPLLRHAAQASVLRYVLIERHSPATIAELNRNLPFDLEGDEIELAVRELDRAELLTMNGAALAPGALLKLADDQVQIEGEHGGASR